MDLTKHDKVLCLLKDAQANEHDMREHSEMCHAFIENPAGQWEKFWADKCKDKPQYTFDLTTPIVDQIAGDIAEADFAIRVSPLGGDAKKDLASVRDGIIRNIQMQSGARYIFNDAGRNTVIGGIDGWRVVQKYLSDTSFHQDLGIEPIYDYRNRVWHDPGAVRRDKSDARYCFVLHSVLKDDYEDRWPKGSGMSIGEDRQVNSLKDAKDVVVVAELLFAKQSSIEIAYMSDGSTLKVDSDYNKLIDERKEQGVTEKKRRKVKETTWYSRFMDQSDWLEDEKETAFTLCPVIPEYADFAILDNVQSYRGEVSRLMDPARVLNYSVSREIEEGALAPRSKLTMTKKMAEGKDIQDKLATLNTNTDPVLFFNPDPAMPNGPGQIMGAQINPGLRSMSEAMRGMMGFVSGRFAAAMGDNVGLQSGVAIDSQIDRSNIQSNKYLEGHALALCATGRVINGAIPRVYDTERQIRILNEDGTQEIIAVNRVIVDQQTGKPITTNDLSSGDYDVFCEAGPSFKNRQEQTMSFLMDMAKADPTYLQQGGDLILNSLPFPAAKQLAERKRAQLLAQGVIPESQMTDEEKMQAQAAAQNKQPDPAMLLAMAEMKKAEAESLNAQVKLESLKLEQMKLQLEGQGMMLDNQIDSGKLAIEGFKAQTGRLTAEITAREAGQKAPITNLDIQGKALDNAQKMRNLMTPDKPDKESRH